MQNVTEVLLARCRRAGGILAAAVAALALSARPGLAANATLTSLGEGLYNTVQGTLNGNPETLYFGGVLHIRIDGGPETDSYCVDIQHGISFGDTEPQVTPNYPCAVVYILNNAFPRANNIPGALSDVNREAAAVQASIWQLTDPFVVTGPADIVARANQIDATAQSQCGVVPAVPQTITVTPATATNVLPSQNSHSVTATVTDTHGNPVTNQPIQVVVTGVSGPQTFTGTTDGLGQFQVTYTNTFGVPGSDSITASVSFTVPVGLEFKVPTEQGIVLAGEPQTGTVTGSAVKNWVAAKCGDGIVNQAGEECDDGNLINGDGCDNNCTITRCGNGIVDPGEQCDDGNGIDGDGCDHNCTFTGCGNGIVTLGEQCDDGNLVDGDGCDHNCTLPGCGNVIVDPGEQCDDGNHINGDGCDNNCTFSGCGNGIVDPGEECDDGNHVNGDGCDNNCTAPACGNGILDPGEQCDDGNHVNGDGCDANCTLPACGNGIVDAGEQCDDGNHTNGDGCEANCTLPTCGNGIVDPGEQCDDGNTVNGDGCSSTCQLQEICNDLVDNDGNGLIDCEDPACPPCLQILRDPASVQFRPGRPDILKIQGGIIPSHPIDPATMRAGVLMTNADGVIYRALLNAGDLQPHGTRWQYVDKTAASRPGGGIFKIQLFNRQGIYHVKVKAYGDLSHATLPTMAAQFQLGDDVYLNRSVWRQRGNGWHLQL
jgi:cysteine-rich repeat protein